MFAAVVAICDAQGLIGREMFAIDGVKLPSNASKRRSGTRADFERQADEARNRGGDDARSAIARRTACRPNPRSRPRRRSASSDSNGTRRSMREWLAANPDDRRGVKGAIRKSNRTDNESAKMATGKGVIQGYTGVAAVDDAHQIIVEAQAHGTGSEQELLLPVVTAMQAMLVARHSLITADAGYHSEANLQQLAAMPVDGAHRRQRDAPTRRALHDAGLATRTRPIRSTTSPSADAEEPAVSIRRATSRYDAEARTCVCPAGKSLNRTARITSIGTTSGRTFRGRNATASRARIGRCASAHRRRRPCAPSCSFRGRPRRCPRRTRPE